MTSTASSNKCVARPIPTWTLILSFLLLVLVSNACSQSNPNPTPRDNSGGGASSGSSLTSTEKAAITTVQQYSVDGSNNVLDWLTVAFAAKKGKGDNIDLSGAYWSARENGERIQVRFWYKEDGNWLYAEWRYVPSSGYVAGENEMGKLTIR